MRELLLSVLPVLKTAGADVYAGQRSGVCVILYAPSQETNHSSKQMEDELVKTQAELAESTRQMEQKLAEARAAAQVRRAGEARAAKAAELASQPATQPPTVSHGASSEPAAVAAKGTHAGAFTLPTPFGWEGVGAKSNGLAISRNSSDPQAALAAARRAADAKASANAKAVSDAATARAASATAASMRATAAAAAAASAATASGAALAAAQGRLAQANGEARAEDAAQLRAADRARGAAARAARAAAVVDARARARAHAMAEEADRGHQGEAAAWVQAEAAARGDSGVGIRAQLRPSPDTLRLRVCDGPRHPHLSDRASGGL